MSILTAVLLGALLHAAWNAFIRAADDKDLNTILIAGGAGLCAGGAIPFLPVPAVASWPYLAASVCIHLVYFSFVARLYRGTDLSFAYTIMRGTAPALSAVVAMLLLRESPSAGGWMGTGLVSLGVLILTGDTWRSGSLRLFPTMLALLNAGIIVAYTLADGMGARLSGHPAGYTAWMFFLTAIPLLLLYLGKKNSRGAKALRSNWRTGVLGGACSVGSYGLALWAMTQAPIALVAALRETSVAFATVIAVCVLGEKVTPLRYASVAVVTGGAIAIKLA